jgi:hypothetical protein
MLKVSLHFATPGMVSARNVLGRVDIGYARLDATADYKAVLQTSGLGEAAPVSLKDYPRWSASVWDLVARVVCLSVYRREAVWPAELPLESKGAFLENLTAVVEHWPDGFETRRATVATAHLTMRRRRCHYKATFEDDLTGKREVIQLIVHCLFAGDAEALAKPGVVRSMYDPTAGTGGILSVGEAVARSINASAVIKLFGQELNDESYAICKADMLIKGQDQKNIVRSNTLSADGFPQEKFDYGAANPPFGVDWKKVLDFVKSEHERRGFAGRFGPGLPRISDGSLLFLMHLISKMRPKGEGGGRPGRRTDRHWPTQTRSQNVRLALTLGSAG